MPPRSFCTGRKSPCGSFPGDPHQRLRRGLVSIDDGLDLLGMNLQSADADDTRHVAGVDEALGIGERLRRRRYRRVLCDGSGSGASRRPSFISTLLRFRPMRSAGTPSRPSFAAWVHRILALQAVSSIASSACGAVGNRVAGFYIEREPSLSGSSGNRVLRATAAS